MLKRISSATVSVLTIGAFSLVMAGSPVLANQGNGNGNGNGNGQGNNLGNSQVQEKTCKDVPGFTTNLESDTSGVWGSIEFTQDNGPLLLTVNEGYSVTLCIKKGTEPIVLDPTVGPVTDKEVNYPATDPEDGFSHYAVIFAEVEVPTEEPEVPTEEPEVPVQPERPVGGRGEQTPTPAPVTPASNPAVLPVTSGSMTKVVALGAFSFAGIALLAASVVKKRFLLS